MTGISPCCGGGKIQPACGSTAIPPDPSGSVHAAWSDGFVTTGAGGEVPRVRTETGFHDRIGSIKVRWGFGRMGYSVPPGLYAVGNPGAGSPVLASANYKMSFDRLRYSLSGRDAWILVLDTGGVNVWCSAGKGTFGTEEIVHRVQESALDRVVSHRVLVAPQLGAPGVSAHEVRRRCGFRVQYGPVRAEDLPAYLNAGMKALPGMRRVRFDLRDRAVLIPVELVMGGKYALLLAGAFLILGGLGAKGYTLDGVRTAGLSGAAVVLAAFLGGATLGPILLPWLPGRAFSVKGAVLGLALAGGLAACGWIGPGTAGSWPHLAAWFLLVPSLVSFAVMNFTGASTYTSLSGVLREMRFAVPAQAAAALLGFGFWLGGLYIA